MGRKKLSTEIKVKRMTFGITPKAQAILQTIPPLKMSKFVSEAIIKNPISHVSD